MTVAPAWIEQHCVIPDGFRAGAPFLLYDYQLQFFGAHYLVKADAEWVPEAPVLGPAFVYRRSLLVGPQKLGKGPHTAAHVCLEGAGPSLFAGWAGGNDGYSCSDWGCRCGWEYPYEPGEPMGMPWPTPLIQITAFSSEQTDNVYDALRPMIDKGPLSDVIPKTGEEFIRLPGGGRIDTVTSSAQSRLGQRVTFVPQDEVGIWTPRNKMTKVASTQYRGLAGMGGRAALTTNAWDPTEKSVGQQEYESPAVDIHRQFVRPPQTLRYTNKRDRAKIHRIVYPKDVLRQNGGHVDLDAIEAEAADLLAKDPAEAARFFGNIVSASGGHPVDAKQWQGLRTARTVEPGERVGLGFDGSISEDTTALIGCTEDRHLFVPLYPRLSDGLMAPTIWSRPERAPDGWRIPRAEVEHAVAYVFGILRVGRMLCDPPKWWAEIEAWQARWNLDDDEPVVLGFDTNQPKRMAAACDRFTTAVAESACSHDGNPVLTDHVLAMVRRKAYVKAEDETDGRTRYVFAKGDDGRKIDAGIGATLALEAVDTMPAAPEPAFAASGGSGEDVYRPSRLTL